MAIQTLQPSAPDTSAAAPFLFKAPKKAPRSKAPAIIAAALEALAHPVAPAKAPVDPRDEAILQLNIPDAAKFEMLAPRWDRILKEYGMHLTHERPIKHLGNNRYSKVKISRGDAEMHGSGYIPTKPKGHAPDTFESSANIANSDPADDIRYDASGDLTNGGEVNTSLSMLSQVFTANPDYNADGNDLDKRKPLGYAVGCLPGGRPIEVRRGKKNLQTGIVEGACPWWIVNDATFKEFCGSYGDDSELVSAVLYKFYRLNESDETLLADIPDNQWKNAESLKKYRQRLLAAGNERYGSEEERELYEQVNRVSDLLASPQSVQQVSA